MTVTVDYNNDQVTIVSPQIKIVFDKVKNLNMIKEILEEIFNVMDESRLASATPYFDISLELVDEDTRLTVGEW